MAFLYQNDDFGKDLLAGFRHAIQGTNIQLAATQSYELTDATVDSQVVNLQASGADVFMNTGQSKQASQAIKKAGELGWKPLQVIGSFSSSVKAVIEPAGLDNAQGLVTGIYLKDPTDAQWANDPGVKEYREVLAKHCSGCNPDDSLNVSGLMYAKTMVAALEGMKAPTRQAFMDSVKNLDISGGVLLDGVRIKTGPKDGYPIEAVVMGVFKGRNWELQGQVIDLEGKTPIVKE